VRSRGRKTFGQCTRFNRRRQYKDALALPGSGYTKRSGALPETGLKCHGPTATVVLSVESKKEQPSFEEALTKLESIVESMESGEVPLADLIARFEQGTKLLQVCESRLKEAELRIEQLKKSKDGSVAFEKFETDREA